MAMRHDSVDDDIPHAVLGMSTDESLGAVASIQEVDTLKPLPPLNWVPANTMLELPEDFRLPRLARGFILGALHSRAEMVVDGEQDVLNCDVGLPRREAGVGGNVE